MICCKNCTVWPKKCYWKFLEDEGENQFPVLSDFYRICSEITEKSCGSTKYCLLPQVCCQFLQCSVSLLLLAPEEWNRVGLVWCPLQMGQDAKGCANHGTSAVSYASAFLVSSLYSWKSIPAIQMLLKEVVLTTCLNLCVFLLWFSSSFNKQW